MSRNEWAKARCRLGPKAMKTCDEIYIRVTIELPQRVTESAPSHNRVTIELHS